MKGLRSYSGKIIIVAFFVSLISAVLSMALLFTSTRGPRSKTSAIWETAQRHTPTKPEKTDFNIVVRGRSPCRASDSMWIARTPI